MCVCIRVCSTYACPSSLNIQVMWGPGARSCCDFADFRSICMSFVGRAQFHVVMLFDRSAGLFCYSICFVTDSLDSLGFGVWSVRSGWFSEQHAQSEE